MRQSKDIWQTYGLDKVGFNHIDCSRYCGCVFTLLLIAALPVFLVLYGHNLFFYLLLVLLTFIGLLGKPSRPLLCTVLTLYGVIYLVDTIFLQHRIAAQNLHPLTGRVMASIDSRSTDRTYYLISVGFVDECILVYQTNGFRFPTRTINEDWRNDIETSKIPYHSVRENTYP